MKNLLAAMALLLGAAAWAQHAHPPAKSAPKNTAEANHHAFLDAERAAIERGEGFGMALAADRNGFPGPKHILEWKKELKLSAQQEAAVQKLFDEMKQKAIARGKELLAAEERLGKYFAEGRSEDELREETYRVSTLRAELRWVHLSAHLAAKKILAPEQVHAYMRLRHGH
jgi:Spy/CpxP family protein refolding chaperone